VSLTLTETIVILVLGAYGLYVFQALRIRELALLAARRACREAGVQLLDETVSVKRLSLSRDQRGRWRVWRQYQFEYSIEGYERETGHVIMLGNQLRGLVMAERPVVHH
jgi:hypothetical protein